MAMAAQQLDEVEQTLGARHVMVSPVDDPVW